MDESTDKLVPNVASGALAQQGLESAQGFLKRLILPMATELGLLIADPIRIWRLKNQVKILNKAKEICEKQKIDPKAISVKLLVPLLENASLEEDEELQNRWAILLANLVDSNNNIANHVFPYILGQISKNEFLLLEAYNDSRINRVRALEKELEIFLIQKPLLVDEAERKLEEAKISLQNLGSRWGPEWSKLDSLVRKLGYELDLLKRWKESILKSKIKEPEVIQEGELKEFELSNLVRLGLIKEIVETLPHSQKLDIPRRDEHDERPITVDLEVEIESNNYLVLTQLGELFIDACMLRQPAQNARRKHS